MTRWTLALLFSGMVGLTAFGCEAEEPPAAPPADPPAPVEDEPASPPDDEPASPPDDEPASPPDDDDEPGSP